MDVASPSCIRWADWSRIRLFISHLRTDSRFSSCKVENLTEVKLYFFVCYSDVCSVNHSWNNIINQKAEFVFYIFNQVFMLFIKQTQLNRNYLPCFIKENVEGANIISQWCRKTEDLYISTNIYRRHFLVFFKVFLTVVTKYIRVM